MVWLKECPRCQGDLFLDHDHYGQFKTCVQCGYMKDLVENVVGETTLLTAVNGADNRASFRAFTALLAANVVDATDRRAHTGGLTMTKGQV